MPSENAFPIVGIGASAGGLEAFRELLKHLPLDTGMAFVLVQHLDPARESALTELLAKATRLPVREVMGKLPVEPNHVYIISPNTILGISQGILKTRSREESRTPHRSVDAFFESLAQDRHEKAIGVVLSGTASDGTLGLEAIKAEAGITFAQDESAQYDSMPRSAVTAGCVDFVLSPKEIAKELGRISKHPYVGGKKGAYPAPENDRASATAHENDNSPLPSGGRETPKTGTKQIHAEAATHGREESGAENGYEKILMLLHNHCGVDFSLYKSTTIRRRINRRTVLNRKITLEEYVQFLRGNEKELDALYSDVLISVTSFFRNPEVFEFLKRQIFHKIVPEQRNEPVRMWTLGCSTGQEAYSLAMSFMEFCDNIPRAPKLQIFATDLNETLLEKARIGLYAKGVADDLSPERLRRFFIEEDGGYRIIKPLREMIVFARQNILRDPPFSRMNLISCRNLLIYLEPDAQKKAMPAFHYALKPNGCLFLGASESVGTFTDLFDPADKKHKIYFRKSGPTPPMGFVPGRSDTGKGSGLSAPPDAPKEFRGEVNVQREADRITRSRYAPPSILIDAGLQILEFRGDTSPYLKPPKGQASFNVLKMANDDLVSLLRKALDKAKKENKTIRTENVRIGQNGHRRTINFEVAPLKNVKDLCFLVFFEDVTSAKSARKSASSDASTKRQVKLSAKQETSRIHELEIDLVETRDFLQSLQEQQEAANEELQASNEEVTSANEELQSINEELETSKEELESANEELITVNKEMTNRNAELNQLYNDLVNFQSSTQLAVVLLGRSLTIRRFSAQAEKQFNLLATDVGRPIADVRHNLVFSRPVGDGDAPVSQPLDMENFIANVIETVREAECEVQDREGRWYYLRVRPYITFDNKMDGAVMVLFDIDLLKRTERTATMERDYAKAMVQAVHDPFLILNADLHVHLANEAFYNTFEVLPAETEGRLIYDLGNRQWDIKELHRLLENVLPKNSFFDKLEIVHDFERLGRRIMLLNARMLIGAGAQPARIILGIRDVTQQRNWEDTLQQEKRRAEAANQAKSEFLANMSHEIRTPMNAVMGLSSILAQTKGLPEKQAEMVDTLQLSAQSLLGLINDLLDIAKIETNSVDLERIPFSFSDIIGEIFSILSFKTREQGITLDYVKSDLNAQQFLGDPLRVRQVLMNLISNAVKFTENGRVTVSMAASPHERPDYLNVDIAVSDTGIGIPPKKLEEIFEKFTQGDASTSRKFGGTGLGLAISKNLTEIMGGSITVKSNPGKGSEFILHLPLELCSETSVSVDVAGNNKKERPEIAQVMNGIVLLAEDYKANVLVAVNMIESLGYHCDVAANGIEALEKIRAKRDKYAAVLMDVQMPDMDGFEATKIIRKEENEKALPRLPIIAITAHALRGDKERCLKSGMDDYISKPFQLIALRAAFDRLKKTE